MSTVLSLSVRVHISPRPFRRVTRKGLMYWKLTEVLSTPNLGTTHVTVRQTSVCPSRT